MAMLHARALRRGGAWMAAPVACFLGAMFSKENGLVAVGLVGPQDLLLGNDESAWRPPRPRTPDAIGKRLSRRWR